MFVHLAETDTEEEYEELESGLSDPEAYSYLIADKTLTDLKKSIDIINKHGCSKTLISIINYDNILYNALMTNYKKSSIPSLENLDHTDLSKEEILKDLNTIYVSNEGFVADARNWITRNFNWLIFVAVFLGAAIALTIFKKLGLPKVIYDKAFNEAYRRGAIDPYYARVANVYGATAVKKATLVTAAGGVLGGAIVAWSTSDSLKSEWVKGSTLEYNKAKELVDFCITASDILKMIALLKLPKNENEYNTFEKNLLSYASKYNKVGIAITSDGVSEDELSELYPIHQKENLVDLGYRDNSLAILSNNYKKALEKFKSNAEVITCVGSSIEKELASITQEDKQYANKAAALKRHVVTTLMNRYMASMKLSYSVIKAIASRYNHKEDDKVKALS